MELGRRATRLCPLRLLQTTKSPWQNAAARLPVPPAVGAVVLVVEVVDDDPLPPGPHPAAIPPTIKQLITIKSECCLFVITILISFSCILCYREK